MKKIMSIGEFASLSGISRPNLIFYDEIDLLKPKFRGENNYRYYSYSQLDYAGMIDSLKSIGMSLKEIKAYAQKRSFENMIDLFTVQEEIVRQKISELDQIREMMLRYITDAQNYLQAELDEIQLIECAAERIFTVPEQDSHKIDGVEKAYSMFYDHAESEGIPIIYPEGIIYKKEHFFNKEWEQPKSLFVKSSKGKTVKSKGLYAVAYTKGDDDKVSLLAERMINYINRENLRAADDIYVEYPLNEAASETVDEYYFKISVPVMKC